MFTNPQRFWRWLAIAVAIGLVGSSAALAAKPPKLAYQILQLDLVDQWGVAYAESVAYDISDQGQVVGYVLDPSGNGLPACWTISTVDGEVQSVLNLLSQQDTTSAAAEGINENGEIVGVGTNLEGKMVGLYWAHDGALPQELPCLPTDDESRAFAINKNGIICGISVREVLGDDGQVNVEERAVVWRVNGGIFVCGPVELELDTPQLARAVAISDNDINNCATVVGESLLPPNQDDSAVAWTVLDGGGTLEVVDYAVLNDLGVAAARGVNNYGAVCGHVYTGGTTWESVVWSGDSTETLNIARFYTSPFARDINNQGVIVGTAGNTRTTAQRAVMWDSVSASMIVLDGFLDDNSPFGILCAACAVNDSGTIVGFGWDGAGCTAFLAVRQ